jgi:hypothetical protein
VQREIEIKEISASNDQVQIKGFSGQRGYSIVSFPADIDIPKLGSVMVLDVSFHAPEPEPELPVGGLKQL